jgi:hypothetical protein
MTRTRSKPVSHQKPDIVNAATTAAPPTPATTAARHRRVVATTAAGSSIPSAKPYDR